MNTETPLIDFAPKAAAVIIKCQQILAEYVVPDSGITDSECINRLLEILDDQELVKGMKFLDDYATLKSTGITDRNGIEINEGDSLLLEFGTTKLKGIAKQYPDGEWQIYKDEGNHVGILNNRELITVLR